MRCEEFQDHLMDLLYGEAGPASQSPGLQEHLSSCASCRREFEELKRTRSHLRAWEDESLLRSVSIPAPEFLLSRRGGGNYLRYAAIAAMVLIGFLIFANAEITLDRNGFSYRSQLWTGSDLGREYYTKSEVRDLVKRALDDSELRASEINNVLARKILDTVEREYWMEARLERTTATRNRN